MVKTMLRRRELALAGAGVALGLAGCAAEDTGVTRTSPAATVGNGLLRPWLTLTGGWRLAVRVRRQDDKKPGELRAFLRNGSTTLSETWSYILPVN